MLIVDEFLIIAFNGEEATRSRSEMWKMSFKCEVDELNKGNSLERIGLFSIDSFKRLISHILSQVVDRIDFRGRFNALHKMLFGSEMPDCIFYEVMTEVHKAKLADIYTVHNYAMALKRVIQAHPELYNVRFAEG